MSTIQQSPSPPVFAFPNNNRPPSPTKSDSGHSAKTSLDIKPNAHPYSIKTTSTAALSRSNSTSASPAARHHYVPHSPHRDRTNSTGGKERRGEYRGHRYSRSLSSSEDMYSYPAGNGSSSSVNQPSGPRALPIPPNVSNNSIAAMAEKQRPPQVSPKRWTPEQLAAHLGTEVSAEAGEWAAKRGVGGKAFMHMGDEDLAALGAPPSLSPAARALRQEVFNNRADTSSPASSGSSNGDYRRSGSASPTRIQYGAYEVEEPIDEANEDDDNTPSKRNPIKPMASPHIQASATPFFSQESPSANTTTGGRFRNGRVQGMVRSFESSGSESEGGSPERERRSGFRTINGNGSGFRNNGRSGPPSAEASDEEGFGTMRPLPARPDGLLIGAGGMLVADDTGATVKGPFSRSPAPMDAAAALSLSEEELTVEELLAREYGINGTASNGSNAKTAGTWGRKKGRRSRPDQAESDLAFGEMPTSRPLPAEPRKKRYMTPTGVHAWEAEEEESGEANGLTRSTMKRVPSATPNAESVFATVPETEAEAEVKPESAPVKAETDAERRKRVAQEEEKARERGRARGEEIRSRLLRGEEEREELKGMVEAFKQRLEEVEKRVGAMEERARKPIMKVKEPQGQAQAQAPLTLAQRIDPRRLLALFSPASNTNADFEPGPTSISGLPSYVLLVSLGVCAVVLRVLVRKGLGTRAARAA